MPELQRAALGFFSMLCEYGDAAEQGRSLQDLRIHREAPGMSEEVIKMVHRKDCDCKAVGSVHNPIVDFRPSEGKLFQTMYVPICSMCKKPWKLEVFRKGAL